MNQEDGITFSQAVNSVLAGRSVPLLLSSEDNIIAFKADVKSMFWLLKSLRNKLDCEIRGDQNASYQN